MNVSVSTSYNSLLLNSTLNDTSSPPASPLRSQNSLLLKLRESFEIITSLKSEIRSLKNRRSEVPPPVGVNEKLKVENRLLKIQMETKDRENTVLERRCERLKDELRELSKINGDLKKRSVVKREKEGRVKARGRRFSKQSEESNEDAVKDVAVETSDPSSQSQSQSQSTQTQRTETEQAPPLNPKPSLQPSSQPSTEPSSTFPRPFHPDFNLQTANVRLRMSWPSQTPPSQPSSLGDGFGGVTDVMESWEIENAEGSIDFTRF
ncbi:hypothetical protein TrST_g2564 [Triparma strigata]|uniref:Uncharacterized protein n=1 Tax=Triparma strigata TaxID=1606541 RepID=A0A9W7AMI3_9STRA|nr:hypothetical protein TrST_g2564 [Triparma strigata]